MGNRASNLKRSLFPLLVQLWTRISRRRQLQFLTLLILMVLTSFAEIFSIGMVVPFLGVLTAPNHIFSLPVVNPLLKLFGIADSNQLLLPISLLFGFGVLLAGSMRLALLWGSTRISFATGADLSAEIYRRTLYQPYLIHCRRNSSEMIDGISGKANGIIYNTLMPCLALISSFIILISILISLLIVKPLIALIAFGGFGIIYLLIIRMTRKRLMLDSQRIAKESPLLIKLLQEGLGGIRDVLIDGTQETFARIYRESDMPLRRAQGNSIFIGASPRYAIEALGMILIIFLAYSMAKKPNGIAEAIPVLGAFALGAQRLLPVLQQAYSSWVQIKSGQTSLQIALNFLSQALPKQLSESEKKLAFNQHIVLKNVKFRYGDESPMVLNGINLTIKKGGRIGFIGATGSGKSTLLDLVMGLLEPCDGFLEVDGQKITAINNRAWQMHIAHVPQTIYLSDSSIEENIAFGIPGHLIDFSRVEWAAQKAQISDTIKSWPDQYKTFVGERGVRLSGGQRQRIGIARALYKRADVIIFDEATSALDNDTELAVMQAIEGLDKDLTVLIIAHRLTTLRACTKIVELSQGQVKRIGTYREIIN